MSEDFWAKLIDHLIGAFVTLGVAVITAAPVVILGWLKLRTVEKKTDRNAGLTQSAAAAAKIAVDVAVETAGKIQKTADLVVDGKEATIETIKHALDDQTQELKEAIKKNGH